MVFFLLAYYLFAVWKTILWTNHKHNFIYILAEILTEHTAFSNVEDKMVIHSIHADVYKFQYPSTKHKEI